MKKKHKHLSESDLLNQTEMAAKTEKNATYALLEYLCEVDERRAFARDLYTSLFDYLVRGLKYSESQASERVAAVRLMRKSVDARESIESGKLTLTSAAQIQRFIQLEKKTSNPIPMENTKRLIQDCADKSKREVERILFDQASVEVKPKLKERSRHLGSIELHLTLILDEKIQQKIDRAKELLHTDTHAELFERALDALIAEKEQRLGKVTAKSDPKKESSLPTPPAESAEQDLAKNPNSRYIPVMIKKILFERSKGQCEFVSQTHQRCSSRTHLEVDHIIPFALGGKTQIQNLRLLCRNHNQYRARRMF